MRYKLALVLTVLLAASYTIADTVDYSIISDPPPGSGENSLTLGGGVITYKQFNNKGANYCSTDQVAAYHVTNITGIIAGIPVVFTPPANLCLEDNLAVYNQQVVLDWWTPLVFSIGSETIGTKATKIGSDITYDFPLYGIKDALGLTEYAFLQMDDPPVEAADTPEPATLLLLLLSVAGTVLCRRKSILI